MQHYAISEQRIKRIIRFPTRIEEGVAEDTIAAMQPAGAKGQQEIWVMYSIFTPKKESPAEKKDFVEKSIANYFLPNKKIRVITAWRYPGKSPSRDPIPEEILSELRSLL
ncbi:MAG: hypothetical protein WCO21_02750 [bacterium]